LYRNSKPTVCVQYLFSENLAVYEIMWKNMIESDRRMRFTCWITNATDTHSEYVIRFFSTATIVTRACLNVTLYVHCLSRYS